MCAIDFSCELGEALGGNTIYPSLEDLQKNHECLEHCGFEEVVTLSKEDFKDLVAKAGIDPQTIHGSNTGQVFWTKELGLLKKTQETQ
jgi:hypothetical protein